MKLSGGRVPMGCSVPPQAFMQTWVSSDPADVQFSNTMPGLATCANATSGVVTVTATQKLSGQTAQASAKLTCN
ncbi:hypothetical protein [Candidatus Korobacter versatilis]|uniref:hypothetical protein n=1 Tax=Candidatus Korobacter versatilis TaxID=658062 RepID=UPI0005A484F8|nr:hypothetical protein [Candidatus Koribacter versatilis]